MRWRDIIECKFPNSNIKFADSMFDDAILGYYKPEIRIVYSWVDSVKIFMIRNDIKHYDVAIALFKTQYEQYGDKNSPVFIDKEMLKLDKSFVGVNLD